jgi:phospholipid transport system substrate-binding protein
MRSRGQAALRRTAFDGEIRPPKSRMIVTTRSNRDEPDVNSTRTYPASRRLAFFETALRRMVAFGVLVLALAGPAAPSLAKAGPPSDLVAGLNATLIEVMKNAETLGFQGRLAKLEPALSRAFNYPLMARIAVSQYWKKLTPEQQKLLAQRFADLSAATFAARFDGYKGESFQIIEEVQRPRDTILVENHLIKANGEAVALNYLVRESSGRWWIVDVYLDAKFSELAIKRSEFTSVLSKRGFDALIAEIDTRISDMQKEAKS